MVALIHEGLDDDGQFRPNLRLMSNINCIVFIMSLLSSKDEHNQTVKQRIAEEIGLKMGNSFSKNEIDSM